MLFEFLITYSTSTRIVVADEMNSPRMDGLQTLVDDLNWEHLTATGPGTYVNPAIKTALGNKSAYDKLCSEAPLTYAPGLDDVLSSPSPPSIEYFESLPVPEDFEKGWGVYGIVLAKPDGRSKLYIGSGTDSAKGHLSRVVVYVDKKAKRLPVFVKLAYEAGWKLKHIGMICWQPIPRPGLQPRLRARILTKEAFFTTHFFAAFETRYEGSRLLLEWDRDDVDYDPMGSHSPLLEKFNGDLGLTDEELEALAVARREWAKGSDERERAKDPEAYLARKRKEKAAWTALNKEKVAEQHRNTIRRTLAAKKHYCSDCEVALASPAALKLHLLTKSHLRKVADIANGRQYIPSQNAARSAKHVAAAKASKKNYCTICGKAFGLPAHLKKHLTSKKHLAKAKLLEEAVTPSSL